MQNNLPSLLGLHHVTAIAGDPQANYDFYSGVLGLRLVKKTVNFDDPYTYHLYYGDGVGSPGTLITFFPWPHAPRGRRGVGQTTATAFAVPTGALDFWMKRLSDQNMGYVGPWERFGDRGLSVFDADGMVVEIVESATADGQRVYREAGIPAEYALRGFHSVTLDERTAGPTEGLVTGLMGYTKQGQEDQRVRYTVGAGAASEVLDVVLDAGGSRGSTGQGTVHHIAFRIATDDEQQALLRELERGGHHASPVMDRNYFHSIYFREAGGVLFEVATDPPGFTVDETVEELGHKLLLPPWLEPDRAKIEARLPRLVTVKESV